MEYYSPKTLNELIEIANKYKTEAAIVSGGTDAIVKPNFFKDKKVVIDITSIKELQNIEERDKKIRIGSGVTFSKLMASDLIKNNINVLYQAAKVCGSVQIRNRGTIGGNIINASPAAESIPPLMVLNALLILVSKEGEEQISIKEFFKGPGKTALKPGQILAYIEIDKSKPEAISFYRKIGTRKALSIAKASIAFKANKTKGKLTNVEIAYGSVGPTVISSKKAKNFLEGAQLNNDTIEKASLEAFEEVTPIDDIRSTAEYRKLVVKNVIIEELKQFL